MTPDRELCRGVARLSIPEQLKMREEHVLLSVLLRTGSNERRGEACRNI